NARTPQRTKPEIPYAVRTQTLRSSWRGAGLEDCGGTPVAESVPGARCSIKDSSIRNVVARYAPRFTAHTANKATPTNFTTVLIRRSGKLEGNCLTEFLQNAAGSCGDSNLLPWLESDVLFRDFYTGFPRNRKNKSMIRIITTSNSRMKARLWWNWSTMKR